MIDKNNYKIDFSNVKDFWDIHTTLEKDLDLFEYYGDLDSLYDCLTNMLCNISIIEIYGMEKLKKHDGYDQRLLKVFCDTKHAWGEKSSNRFFVTIIHDDGTREEIK